MSTDAGAPDIRLPDIQPNRVIQLNPFDMNIGTEFEKLVFIHHNSPLETRNIMLLIQQTF